LGVYQNIVDVLKPGIRENEIVALANKRLYEMGSDQVEAVNAISGNDVTHIHITLQIASFDRAIKPSSTSFTHLMGIALVITELLQLVVQLQVNVMLTQKLVNGWMLLLMRLKSV